MAISNKMSFSQKVNWLIAHNAGSGDGIGGGLGPTGGTNADPITWSTADKNWLDYRTESTATSGDSRTAYFKHYIAGAGGGGAAIRPYVSIVGVAGSNVYAIEATAEISSTASSSISGEMCVLKATASVNSTTAGTVNVLNMCISTASGKTMHANSAFIYLKNDGSGTDIANFIYFGDAIGTTSTATLVSTSADSTATHTVKCNANGTTIYLLATTTAPH